VQPKICHTLIKGSSFVTAAGRRLQMEEKNFLRNGDATRPSRSFAAVPMTGNVLAKMRQDFLSKA
jgi:hypothetical protein